MLGDGAPHRATVPGELMQDLSLLSAPVPDEPLSAHAWTLLEALFIHHTLYLLFTLFQLFGQLLHPSSELNDNSI